MKKEKRVRLTDDSVNSYGGRVLTSGMDTAQYERNPVLLYMHERGRVIGYMKDLKNENGEISGVPVFDEASELSKQCKRQWEFGSLKMVSVGIDIVEMSESKELVVEGQTSPTITKSRLFEVSVVDIGANDNAIVMHREGKIVTMGRDSENPLPALTINNKPNKEKEMDQKMIALKLGLPETAEESAVLSKIGELQAQRQEFEELKKEKARLEKQRVEAAVDKAIEERRVTAGMREHFVKLGESMGIETLTTTLSAMAPVVKPTELIRPATPGGVTYKKLSEVPEKELRRIHDEQPEEWARLYEAEYGMKL